MNKFLALAIVAATVLAVPAPAFAGTDAADRTSAIALCRTEVASRAGVEADSVQFDQVRLRPRVVRVDFDLWRDGQLQNVRCEVSRSAEQLTIAAITPDLQTVASGR